MDLIFPYPCAGRVEHSSGMRFGGVVGRVLTLAMLGTGALWPALGDAAVTQAGHGSGNAALVCKTAASHPAAPSRDAHNHLGGVDATDCQDHAGDVESCSAGHCIQCMALPVMPCAALDDGQARYPALEPPPYRPERCIAPQTPPRIG